MKLGGIKMIMPLVFTFYKYMCFCQEDQRSSIAHKRYMENKEHFKEQGHSVITEKRKKIQYNTIRMKIESDAISKFVITSKMVESIVKKYRNYGEDCFGIISKRDTNIKEKVNLDKLNFLPFDYKFTL